MINRVLKLVPFLIITTLANAEEAQESPENLQIAYKLTLSDYHTQHINANDINLRAKKEDETVWLGYYYEQSSSFRQLRAGYEHTSEFEFANFVTSLQAANHGFLGFAETVEIGKPIYGILGYGRTNLKPYANLNFDPNDAVTYGVGWEDADNLNINLFAVRDNRVISGQQIVHFVIRKELSNKNRVTLDLFNKNGPPDNQGQSITGNGCAFTYDWPTYFLKIVYDPKVNFTQENMFRVAAGLRF